ncbi:MAG: VWA domain-containing protein, partial [Planctomycetota bacterium]|nr:VWA domain-containing protein [Planctomycetota bacterium]
MVVDGSASMNARDADGKTRMDIARTRLRERLAGLGSEVGVMLMRYDRSPEILMPTTYDRRDLLRSLEGLQVRPVEGDAEVALHLAARLAALGAPAAIWHVTDAPTLVALGEQTPPDLDDADAGAVEALAPPTASERLGLPDDVTLETIDIGLASPRNVGLTAFQIRPRPLERGRFDAFAQIHAQGPGPVDAKLEVRMDDTLVALRDLTIQPGARERLLIPIEASTGAALEITVTTSGDVLPTDDRVVARVPESRPIRLLWVREPDATDPFTQLALMALGEEGVLEAHAATPAA